MPYKKQLDEFAGLSRKLDLTLLLVQDSGILPLSFFSQVHDILKEMTSSLHTLEMEQFAEMQDKINEQLEIMETFEKAHETESLADVGIIKDTIAEMACVEMENPAFSEDIDEDISPEILDFIQPEDDPVPQSIKTESTPLRKDLIEKKMFSDLKKAISLNDKFRFQKELFSGDSVAMSGTIDALNAMRSLNEALVYIEDRYHWNWEDEVAADFRNLLEKFYA